VGGYAMKKSSNNLSNAGHIVFSFTTPLRRPATNLKLSGTKVIEGISITATLGHSRVERRDIVLYRPR
jgi:hypothetical protein